MADRRERRTTKSASSGGQQRSGRYVRLPHDVLDSDAWAHLSPYAVKLLLAVWRRHNGANNGSIPFSRDEAVQALGCHTRTAARAFEELQDKGFLRLTRDSAFSVKTKLAREWEITAEPVGDRPAAADFKRWEPTG